MNIFKTTIIRLLLILIIIGAGASVAMAEQSTVKGTVTDSISLSGIEGATVTCTTTGDSTITFAFGTYTLLVNYTGASLADVNITATATGYCDATPITIATINDGVTYTDQDFTLTPINTAGAASSSPTLCINTALTDITHATTGATGIGAATGLPTGVTAAWASDTITISGTPTESGTFNYSIPLTGGCGTVNATGTIIVTADMTAGAASSSPTPCINTLMTDITHTTTGATGIGAATGLPTGVTAAWASDTITISGTPTESGTFNYSIPLNGGCGTVNTTGTIIVTADMTAGAASSSPTPCINTLMTDITHTTTGATGIGAATGLPTGVTASWASDTITITGTPTESGTFNYSIPLTGGCGTVNATGTITVASTNTIVLSSAAGTDSQTACINASITNITYDTTGATGATITGLPDGVTGNWTDDVVTISGAPTTTVGSPFNYTVTLSGGCGDILTATGDITVNAIPATPTGFSATPAAICAGGSSDLSATVGAGEVVNWYTGSCGGALVGTGSPLTVAPTATTNYYARAENTTTHCESAACALVTVTVNSSDSISLTSATETTDQTLYLYTNTPLNDITYSITDGGTGPEVTGLPAGVAGEFSAGIFTISGTPEEAGTFDYTVTTTGPCIATAAGTITVLIAPPTDERLALNFIQNDGDFDSVSISDDALTSSGTLDLTDTGTLEAWIYPEDFATGAGVVFKGTTENCYGFGFGDTVATSHNIEFLIVDAGGTEYSLTATGKTIEANQWYHIACVWNTGAATDKMIIYINGVPEATSNTVAAARRNEEDLVLGMQTLTSAYYQGAMDEVRVWDTARGPDRIRDTMCHKMTESESDYGDLAGYWRFDENNGIICGDWSGNGNIGLISNAVLICSAAPVGDDSAHDYTGSTYSDFTVTLASGTSDEMTVTGDGGTWDAAEGSCVHVYRVDSPPNYTTSSLLLKPFNNAPRYWGVFKAGGTDPTYTMTYYYDGYPDITNENNLKMAYRNNYCDPWKGLNAALATGNKTLTQSGLSGTEFILGADVDPRNTILYDGSSNYVGVSDEASLDLSDTGTLEAWIYPESFANGAGIVFKDTAAVCYGFGLGGGGPFNSGSNTNIGFVVGDSGGGTDYLLTGTTNLLVDKWYHIACVWDTTAGAGSSNMQIFVNGVQEAAFDFGTGTMNAARQANGQLRFGMQNVSSAYFDGRIDEVRIWDTARNQSQIRNNMCQKIGTRDSSLVGYWRFDEETTSDTSFDFGTIPYNFATMYGFGTAGDIITARICSEAPIGDDSAYAYGSPASATVSHTDGDYFFATNNGGTWTNTFSGLHVYRVDGPPVYPPDINGPLPYDTYVTPNGLTPPYDFSTTPPAWSWSSVDYYRYWGVFLTDWTTASEPQYQAVYDYGSPGGIGNPSAPVDETEIVLAKRDSYCDRTWADAGATLNTTANTLTKSGETQNSPSKTYTEYILAGKNQPLAIALASFTATVVDDCIEISWETATEIDTTGFQLWRSESKEGPYTLVPYSFTASKSVIQSRGAAYAYTDCDVVMDNSIHYYYKLEEIDLDNTNDNPFYGPIGPVTEMVSASQVSGRTSGSDNKACFIESLLQ